jgi:hypothetical protein
MELAGVVLEKALICNTTSVSLYGDSFGDHGATVRLRVLTDYN